MFNPFKGKILLQSLLLLIGIALCLNFIIMVPSQAENTSIVVEYTLGNEKKSITGKKTKSGYQFNRSSQNVINLATLDWPPYIGEGLCNKGWVFQLTVALLVSKGYQVNIHFYPWARSVKMVEQGEMDILFPEYFIEGSAPSDVIKGIKRSELLVLSNQFPGGNISFLKRKGEKTTFDGNLGSLKGELIGVVRGYQNTPEFDAMMDAKLFDVVSAVDELQLMKLLIGKRVDLIIGDPKVFRYSVNYSTLSNSNKQALLDGVEDVKPELKYNHLYFALSTKSAKWRSLLDDINLALLEFKLNGQTQRFLENGSGCVADF